MLASILALLVSLKPVLVPLLTALVGWLVPSPWEVAARGREKTKDAEDRADATRGYVDDLDHLP